MTFPPHLHLMHSRDSGYPGCVLFESVDEARPEDHARVECDHGRLKARLRPMRGLKRDHSASVIVRGHALIQNIKRGHYELGVDARHHRRIEAAFTELAQTI